MKSGMAIFLVFIMVFFYGTPVFAGGVEECCPLPKEFYWKVDGKEDKENKAFEHGGLSGGSFSDALEAGTVDDQPAAEPLQEFDEDESKNYELYMVGGQGIDGWKAGQADSTTEAKQETDPWSPPENLHEWRDDPDGHQIHQYVGQCWQFVKGEWTGAATWTTESTAFAYHFDAPTLWGETGGIGDNTTSPGTDEGFGGSDGKHPGDWTYYVPSVPFNYYASSVMTARWIFDFDKNEHTYIHTPQCKYPSPVCTKCGKLCADLQYVEKNYTPSQVKDVPFTPDQFYDGAAIVDPGVATARQGDKTFDEDGAGGSLFDTGTSFALPDIPADVARVAIRVHDIKRITNISFGTGSEAKWKTTTGEKITETDDHSLEFQLIDNAVHMRQEAIDKGAEKAGEFEFENFKARFWYEDMVYDYMGFNNPALGLDEVFYAPKFVWKIGAEWVGQDGFSEFVKHGTSDAMKEGSKVETNPQYTLWELTFQTSELFGGESNEEEDIMSRHYAVTSLGDQFGNPIYKTGEQYTGEGFGSYESVVDTFKNKPLHFEQGRGDLKNFFQIDQCSKKDPEHIAAGHKEFDYAKTYWFKNMEKSASKYQEQVKFNPEDVKYIQEPQGETVDGGTTVNPSQGTKDLEITPYEDMADLWQGKHQMKNGLDDKMFQGWGHTLIEDNDRPIVGLRLYNKSSRKYRKVWRPETSEDGMEVYKSVVGGGAESLERNDEGVGDKVYKDDDEEWKFEKKPTDLGHGEDGSEQGYGCFEDVDLEMSHSDLKNDPNHGSVSPFYAHDNIDGQRFKYQPEVAGGCEHCGGDQGYFYRGVEAKADDREKESGSATGAAYADDYVNRGFISWLIYDNSYSPQRWLEYYREDGHNFIYPNCSFHNPNVKGNGSELNPGASDIWLSYKIHDRAGNERYFKLKFFIKAIDVNINTLERHDRRYQDDDDD